MVGEYIIQIETYLKIPEGKKDTQLSDFWLLLEKINLFMDTKPLFISQRITWFLTDKWNTHQ